MTLTTRYLFRGNTMKKLLLLLLVSMSAHATTAFFKYERVNGMNKICVYESVRGDVAITIRATSLCPLTIEV